MSIDSLQRHGEVKDKKPQIAQRTPKEKRRMDPAKSPRRKGEEVRKLITDDADFADDFFSFNFEH